MCISTLPRDHRVTRHLSRNAFHAHLENDALRYDTLTFSIRTPLVHQRGADRIGRTPVPSHDRDLLRMQKGLVENEHPVDFCVSSGLSLSETNLDAPEG